MHHAGNSSGIVDGAAGILIGSKEFGEKAGLAARAYPRLRLDRSEPTIMLTGPAPASEKALKRAGMSATDIDLYELNEAFAAVVLRYMQALNIPHDKINVNGGAIAMGHPLGATGAMILGTVLDELERRACRPAWPRCASAPAWAPPRSSSGSSRCPPFETRSPGDRSSRNEDLLLHHLTSP